MKKSLIFCISLFLFVFLLSGCENEVKTMTCTKTTNQNNTKMSLNYEVDYKGNYVTKVKSVEIVESDDSEYLNTLKEQTENIYSAYNNIENYNYKTEINGNTFTSTVDIDYEKIDTEKLISIDSSNSQLIKNGKIYINDIKNIYESIGATCK